jgi:flavin reductase (DIM6/NTAB) family NADH-FMN oxidoreductase RutF
MSVDLRDATAEPIDPGRFRRVMGQFATGVTVVTVAVDNEVRGMTANAFMSGSLSPPLCVVSIAKRARMHAAVSQVRRFVVNVLAHDQADLAIQFAGGTGRKTPATIDWIHGAPMLAGALAHIAAELVAEYDCGDHTLFVGQLFDITADETREPLLYHEGRFGALIRSRDDQAIAVPEFW